MHAPLDKDELFTLLALQPNGEGRYLPRSLDEIVEPDHKRKTVYEFVPGDRTLIVETQDIQITRERRYIEDPAAERERLSQFPTVTAPTRPKPDPDPEPDDREIIGACIHGGPDDGCVSCAEAVRLDECKRI